MRVSILQSAAQVAAVAADCLSNAARAKADLALGLPTGRTVVPLYEELARRNERGDLDLGHATALNLDELVLPGAHPASFRAFMERHAWEKIGLDRERCDIPNGDTADLDEECQRYDRALAAVGGLDFAYLGVGVDGHVAYNLPGPTHRDTHVVTLPDRVADSLEAPVTGRPLRAITMGFGPLVGAKHLVLMAVGKSKRAAVRVLLDGPASQDWPCTALRDHPNFDLLLDRAAFGPAVT